MNAIHAAATLFPLYLLAAIVQVRDVSREHSGEMARRGKSISHRGFNQRVEDILKKIPYRAAAENVGFTIGHEDPARTVVEGWRKSPEHRKNMLGAFSLTGIGVAQSKNGGYFFTQIFIEPLK